MKNVEQQQQNQRRFQCQQKGWDVWQAGGPRSTILSSWHRQWHWHEQDLNREGLQLELLHHRPIPLYFGTYFSLPVNIEDIWHRERGWWLRGKWSSAGSGLTSSGRPGHYPEQRTKTRCDVRWCIQSGQGEHDSQPIRWQPGNGGCSNFSIGPKSVKYHSKIWALGSKDPLVFVTTEWRNSVGIRQRTDSRVGDTFSVVFGLLEDWRGLQRRTHFHL